MSACKSVYETVSHHKWDPAGSSVKKASARDRWRSCVRDGVCVKVVHTQSSQCVRRPFCILPPAPSVRLVMHTLHPHMENEEEDGKQEEELHFGTSI